MQMSLLTYFKKNLNEKKIKICTQAEPKYMYINFGETV